MKYKISDAILYKRSLKLERNKLYKTKEICKIFGYKSVTLRMRKYIDRADYIHPTQYWKTKNLIALPYEQVPPHIRINITRLKSGAHITSLKTLKSTYFTGAVRFLINKDELPWWKLKDYHGYL